ncbi:MAG: 3-oxoacyl-[acyl-carrier-protein] reductase [Candidatus Marinimicrobia bacterium]|nr:3-oxoacyl-[acyl-carrier-protein] reductase [Candidatus Neomarinimicrobiota bacterium]
MNLKDKVAVITGSARGIGREIAQSLAKAGATVVISDIDSEATEKTAAELKSEGLNSLAVSCNVTSKTEIDSLIKTVTEKLGKIDIWVNNAGITKDGLLIRMKEADWDLVMDINLKGSFLCTQAVSKVMMKQRSGKIVNIASVSGVIGTAGQANYAASKSGLISLTKVTAREMASRGVNCNAITPGFIRTEMTDKLPEDVQDNYKKLIPLNRYGSTEDVANAVLFLSSKESDYITGQVLSVCGGLVM